MNQREFHAIIFWIRMVFPICKSTNANLYKFYVIAFLIGITVFIRWSSTMLNDPFTIAHRFNDSNERCCN